MKKISIVALFVIFGTMLIAGGKTMPVASPDNAKKSCKADGVYSDYKANLMWQDALYGDVEDGAYKHNKSAGKAGRWEYAKSYCSNLVYSGYDDWRLPTVQELVNLQDSKVTLKHTIDVDFWSSTPSEGNKYWSVYAIVTGQPYEHSSSDSLYIRCVRCLDK